MGSERVSESWSLVEEGDGLTFDVVVSRLGGGRWRVRQSSGGRTVREDDFDDERSCRVLLAVLRALGEGLGRWHVTRPAQRSVIRG